MKILILGATGMLGSQMLRTCLSRDITVDCVVRNKELLNKHFTQMKEECIHTLDDIKDFKKLKILIEDIRPDYIINCIGIVKQASLGDNRYESIAINSYLPHQLASISGEFDFKLIHISTDCVFDGNKGMYKETDPPTAYDVYGLSKYLGEVINSQNAVTLRTSIIGHELTSGTHGLLEWFLKASGSVNGFTKAIFSGFTTNELSRIILDYVIPNNLTGIYQVAAQPIDKNELLNIIKEVYQKDIIIHPFEEIQINRSLDGTRFCEETGYIVPSWQTLIRDMYTENKLV